MPFKANADRRHHIPKQRHRVHATQCLIDPTLLARLGPIRPMSLSAAAGIVRWGTTAQTAWFPTIALVEPRNRLTFAPVHLTCMDVIRRAVLAMLAATAQAVYVTIALGIAGAAVTLASESLYAWLGAASFWFMAGLCALALPVSAWLSAALRDLRGSSGAAAL